MSRPSDEDQNDLTPQEAAQAIRVVYHAAPAHYEYDGLPVYFNSDDGVTTEEAVERMAAVVSGNVRLAREWMDRPSPLLGHRTPRQAHQDGDVDRVVGILANIAGI